MKQIVLIYSFLTIIVFAFTSCNAKPIEVKSEVWEHGIVTINGKIETVVQEKDGQTIRLNSHDGETYFIVVSVSNLGENAHQYREFKVGEEIGFRGEVLVVDDQIRLIAKQVLEYR